MARGKGGQQQEKKEKVKKSALETLIPIITGSAFGDEAKQKVADILNGDASFVSFWQRRTGESIVSARNVVKAIALLGTFIAYRHFDPFPDSKVDNAVVVLVAVVLGTLLAIPQSTELGSHFKTFEARILEAFKDEIELNEVLVWIRCLSNSQEGRLANLVKGMETIHAGDQEKINQSIKNMMSDDNGRAFLELLIGDDEKQKDIAQWVKECWPKIKDRALFVDTWVGVQFINLHENLVKQGVITDKQTRKQRGWFPKFLYWLGS